VTPEAASARRILLDECVPRRLQRALPSLDVSHVVTEGWAGRRNGVLWHQQRYRPPARDTGATGALTRASTKSFQLIIELNTMLNSPWFCQR
jgi:hypothetical protein